MEVENQKDTKEIASFLKNTDANHQGNFLEPGGHAEIKKNIELGERQELSNRDMLESNLKLKNDSIDYKLRSQLEEIPKEIINEKFPKKQNELKSDNTYETESSPRMVEENIFSANNLDDTKSKVTNDDEISSKYDKSTSGGINYTDPGGDTLNTTPIQDSSAKSNVNQGKTLDPLDDKGKPNEIHNEYLLKDNKLHDLKEENKILDNSTQHHEHTAESKKILHDDSFEHFSPEDCDKLDEKSDLKNLKSDPNPINNKNIINNPIINHISSITENPLLKANDSSNKKNRSDSDQKVPFKNSQNITPKNQQNTNENNLKLINEFNNGNYEMIFSMISFLSIIAIILFFYEVYRNSKTNQILSGDISKYEYLLSDDDCINENQTGLRDI